MTSTRSKSEEAFTHVLKNVLSLTEKDQLWLSFTEDGYDSITDIATLQDDEINELEFTKDDKSVKVVKKQRKLLLHLVKWRDWKSKQLQNFNTDDWLKLTSANFTEFCETVLPDLIRGSGKSSTFSSGSVPGVVTSSEVQSFKRSIDKSQSDFPKFNGAIAKWIPTKQTYISVAANHGISRILDDSPVPEAGSKDRELFNVQNQYFYNILKVRVESGKAKVIVNQSATSLDGKEVWRKFIEYYEQQSIASLNKASFFERLANMKLNNAYRGGAARFLNDFETCVTEMSLSTGETMKDSDLVGFLKTSISEYQPFHAIKASLDTNALMTKQDITYEGMLHVLYNNCPVRGRGGGPRNVNSFKNGGRGYGGRGNGGRGGGRDNGPDSDAWKKDFTKWVPMRFFKELPESEQQARREAIAKAKAERKAKINNTSGSQSQSEQQTQSTVSISDISSLTSNNVEVPSELAPTFREIMAAKKVEKKVTSDGDTWIRVVKPCRVVQMSNLHAVNNENGGLVDSGANTSLQGEDMRMLHQEHGAVAVIGPSNGVEPGMDNLSLVTCGGVATNSLGEEVLVVVTSAASYGHGKSIISKFQMEHFGCKVLDKPRLLGGRQIVKTPDGNIFKLKFQSGLMYLPFRYPTDDEVENLRRVYLTSDACQWDPNTFNDSTNDEEWFECHEDDEGALDDEEFYESRDGSILEENYTGDINHFMIDHPELTYEEASKIYQFEVKINGVSGKRKAIDFEKLRPYFLWKPVEAIKKTFAVTTQFVETVWFNTPRLPLRRHYKSRAPFMNVRRLNEGYATDTIFANSKAHDGSTCAQIYVGVTSQFISLEGMKAKSQMPRTLLNFIRCWGAMKFLWRDMAKEEDSAAVNDILRSIQAPNRFSEPYNEHQNPAERKILDVKSGTRTVMDRTGTPSKWWLLCMMYVIYILNHIALASLNWQTPFFKAFGVTRDISPLLLYRWWEPVYYYDADVPFPQSREKLGRFAGFAENVGDSFCFKVVTSDTEQVIYRSVLRSALDKGNTNKRPSHNQSPKKCGDTLPTNGEQVPLDQLTNDDLLKDEVLLTEAQSETQPIPGALLRDSAEIPIVLESENEVQEQGEIPSKRAHFFDPDELIGKTFLREREVDGTVHRAEITERIHNSEAIADQYLVTFGDGQRTEVMNYNAIVDLMNKQIEVESDSPDSAYTFKEISDHRYKNSTYEVLVEWECGEKTWEPIAMMRQDDPVTLAKYGMEHNLLEKPGWKRLRRYVKSTKRLDRNIKQARMYAARTTQRYKFGVKVPRDEKEALSFDEDNKNSLWNDAIGIELNQVVREYNTFRDLGKYRGKGSVPKGYQHIRVHMIFDVKHDLRHKCRLVAGGHLTKPNGDSSYSSVASLRSIRLVTFIAELNDLELEAADVGNAYLEARTNEKVCFVAGPSFKRYGLDGHLLAIDKALYGLRNSGACYHAKWAESMKALGFFPSRADPDVWMRDKGDHYEYVVVYVDDLLYAGKDAKQFWKDVRSMGYKLKGVGPPDYHLGATFEKVKDPEPCMTWGPVRYIQKILEQYERLFGEKVKNSRKIHAPLEPGDHPELDVSELCTDEEKAKYMSMIGCLQWAFSLGRMDIGTATMTMSRFRVQPRVGHLARLKRIYSYLKHFKNSSIKFNTEIPDYEHFDKKWVEPEWGDFYGDGADNYVDTKLPEPKGKPIVMTTYVDANLLHDYITGRSCTGIIHLFNKTAMDWFSKLQANVETATYGSEFTALRTAVDQVHDLRYTARSMGVPIMGPTYLFGDNLSTIISSTKSDGKIAKRWNILSFHRVREAVAHGIVRPFHIDGKDNPADVLSKHTSSNVWYELMRPLIFWRANDNDQVSSVSQGGEGSINVSPPSVNDTVSGDVNVNIGVPKLSNGNVPGHAFTLIFNDGEHQTS